MMAEKQAAPKLTLPTEAAGATKVWTQQKVLMIAQAGVGKSTFWSNGDRTLFIDTEGNLNHLKVKKLGCRSWDDFRDIYEALYHAQADGKFPYDTIVIDTGDRFLALAEEEAIGRAKEKFKNVADRIFTIGDIPEGGGWSTTSKMLLLALEKLHEFPAATVIIAHPKMIKVEEPTAKYDKETVAFWGQVAGQVLGWAHHTLHIQSMYVGETLKRVVRTLPSKGLESKSHGGIVPDRMEWKTADLAEEYKAFRALFT